MEREKERVREKRLARASDAEKRIITGGGRAKEYGEWREETRYALVKNGNDNDDRGPINYWLRAYLA